MDASNYASMSIRTMIFVGDHALKAAEGKKSLSYPKSPGKSELSKMLTRMEENMSKKGISNQKRCRLCGRWG